MPQVRVGLGYGLGLGIGLGFGLGLWFGSGSYRCVASFAPRLASYLTLALALALALTMPPPPYRRGNLRFVCLRCNRRRRAGGACRIEGRPTLTIEGRPHRGTTIVRYQYLLR